MASQATAGPVLQVQNLVKKFGNHTVLPGVSFSVPAGTMLAVTGPSGSGKTTLLNCLGLLENFDSGEFSFGSFHAVKHGSRKARGFFRDVLGFLFQNYGLIEDWSVAENLQLPLQVRQLHKTERRERMAQALAQVGLTGREKSKVYTLSGGEQQRVALARLLLKEPQLILADEPTSALDAANSDVVMQALRQRAAAGALVILSTHNPAIVQLCDSVLDLGTAPVQQ